MPLPVCNLPLAVVGPRRIRHPRRVAPQWTRTHCVVCPLLSQYVCLFAMIESSVTGWTFPCVLIARAPRCSRLREYAAYGMGELVRQTYNGGQSYVRRPALLSARTLPIAVRPPVYRLILAHRGYLALA
jgi:hypothetical protein